LSSASTAELLSDQRRLSEALNSSS
jgi:hypothetical protein